MNYQGKEFIISQFFTYFYTQIFRVSFSKILLYSLYKNIYLSIQKSSNLSPKTFLMYLTSNTKLPLAMTS